MLPDWSVLLLTDILSGDLCPVVSKKNEKIMCPHYTITIKEKEVNYLTIIFWSVVSECHDVNEMDMLIDRWNIVST